MSKLCVVVNEVLTLALARDGEGGADRLNEFY